MASKSKTCCLAIILKFVFYLTIREGVLVTLLEPLI